MKDEESKLSSRKFVVWLIWLLITIAIVIYTFITQESDLLHKALESFFAISMMYLGMNVGQKIGFAFADAIAKNKDNSLQEDAK